ncbi:MAG TPA: hypothetical protein VFK41_09010 [Nocardioidaceae bacterium]|nr:hypothetical protein [Nocardioidaceae bacterium]
MDQISTLISSVTAVVATAVSLFLLRQGQVDRRKLREDEARSQARRITSWADWQDPSDFATFAKPRLPAVFVRNSSDAAVFDVFVDYLAPVDGALFRVAIGPVPPGETRVHSVDYEGPLMRGWEPATLFARVNFRDAAGHRWVRDALGQLREDSGAAHDDFFERGGVILDRDKFIA